MQTYYTITPGMSLTALEGGVIRGKIEYWAAEFRNRAYPILKADKPLKRIKLEVDVRVNTPLTENDWISFLTLQLDPSDDWKRVVCINYTLKDGLHLYHVPNQNQRIIGIQNIEAKEIYNDRWFKLGLTITEAGLIILYKDGVLVESAGLDSCWIYGGHLGFYSNGELTNGYIDNRNLEIWE